MSNIKEKRDALESYLREQIIGPGAGRNRIVRTNSNPEFSALNKPLIENTEEAITVVPGVYYSSGILFPNKSQNNKTVPNSAADIDNDDLENINLDIDEFDENNITEERNLLDTEDDIQMDQMYPKAMGLTFCMEANDLKNQGFEIELSARHYKRVPNQDIKDFGVRIELDITEFQELLKTKLEDFGTLEDYFKVENIKDFSFLKQYKPYPTPAIIDSDGNPVLNAQGIQIKRVKNILNIASNELGKLFFKEHEPLFENFKGNIIYNIDSLLKYIVNNLFQYCTDLFVRNELYNASQKLELYQNFISHLSDAHEIFNGRYGVWESNSVLKKIQISNVILNDSVKKIYTEDSLSEAVVSDETGTPINTLKDLIYVDLGQKQKAALSLNLQLSKNTRLSNNLIYCKVQVVNTSSSFLVGENSYFSMANEGVNERSFFGVQCRIISSNLKPYNERSVNTAINDNEAAAMRFLYRKMTDYGIGHGCSVSWGENYVQTDYMPICDTPDG